MPQLKQQCLPLKPPVCNQDRRLYLVTHMGNLGGSLIIRFIFLASMSSTLIAQIPGYGGPGIASGGTRAAGSRAGESVSIRPYVRATGIYDNGIVAVGLDNTGGIVNPGGLFGIEAQVGAYGSRSWGRTRLGLDYQGGYRHYTAKTFFDGSDHTLGLDFAHQVSRKVQLSFRSMAGTTSRNIGGIQGLGAVDPFFLGVPINDIFDNRSYFLDGFGAVAFQLGQKSFVTLGGSAFAVRRQSKALVGMNGQRALAEFSRMLSRRSTLSLGYQYFRLEYPRVFGGADVHSLMLHYRRQLGRKWNVGMSGGIIRLDFAGIRTVTVDPVIAELFGTSSGREAFNQITSTSAIQFHLGRGFRRSFFSLNYSRGANPGNGALLLNRQDTVMASYSYNASREWSFSGSGGYVSATGYGAYRDRFSNYNAGFQAARRLSDDFHFTAGVGLRKISITSGNFNRLGTRLSIGVAYSPGDLPLSFF